MANIPNSCTLSSLLKKLLATFSNHRASLYRNQHKLPHSISYLLITIYGYIIICSLSIIILCTHSLPEIITNGHNYYSSPILELLCFSSYTSTLFQKSSPTAIFITDFRIALLLFLYIHPPSSRNHPQRPFSSPILELLCFSSYRYLF